MRIVMWPICGAQAPQEKWEPGCRFLPGSSLKTCPSCPMSPSLRLKSYHWARLLLVCSPSQAVGLCGWFRSITEFRSNGTVEGTEPNSEGIEGTGGARWSGEAVKRWSGEAVPHGAAVHFRCVSCCRWLSRAGGFVLEARFWNGVEDWITQAFTQFDKKLTKLTKNLHLVRICQNLVTGLPLADFCRSFCLGFFRRQVPEIARACRACPRGNAPRESDISKVISMHKAS